MNYANATSPELLAEITRLREVLEVAAEAFTKIEEVGARTETIRVGDMYDPHGYEDQEAISVEAEIARDCLAKIHSALRNEQPTP